MEAVSLRCSKKNREERANAVGELVKMERDFSRDLKLTWQAFGLDTPEILEQRGVDVEVVFGNLREVIDTSEAFLHTLQEEVKEKESPDEQMVGKCFLQHATEVRTSHHDLAKFIPTILPNCR